MPDRDATAVPNPTKPPRAILSITPATMSASGPGVQLVIKTVGTHFLTSDWSMPNLGQGLAANSVYRASDTELHVFVYPNQQIPPMPGVRDVVLVLNAEEEIRLPRAFTVS